MYGVIVASGRMRCASDECVVALSLAIEELQHLIDDTAESIAVIDL